MLCQRSRCGILNGTVNQILKTFFRVCVLQPIKNSKPNLAESLELQKPQPPTFKQLVHLKSVYVTSKINPIHQQSLHLIHITVLLYQRQL